MDFTESVVPQNKKTSDENTSNTSNNYESLDLLEKEIDGAYNMIENRFSNLWSSASRNAQDLQKKLNLEKHKAGLIQQMSEIKSNLASTDPAADNEVSVQKKIDKIKQQVNDYEKTVDLSSLASKANQALDSLDSKLEIVENQAGKFVSSFASFFSGVVSANDSSSERKSNTKSIMPDAAYGSSRFDVDLFKLHTSEETYVSKDLDVAADFENFDVDSKSAEISELLQSYPQTLEKTMNNLVPIQTSYKEFWYRYFLHEDKLKTNDQARKELLAAEQTPKSHANNKILGSQLSEEEDDEFTWDDEDDDAVSQNGVS